MGHKVVAAVRLCNEVHRFYSLAMGLCVHPSMRGISIGTHIMRKALREFPRYVALHVDKNKSSTGRLRGFYLKLGMRECFNEVEADGIPFNPRVEYLFVG
jgi:predicted GNAT family N-acyltransferase